MTTATALAAACDTGNAFTNPLVIGALILIAVAAWFAKDVIYAIADWFHEAWDLGTGFVILGLAIIGGFTVLFFLVQIGGKLT